MPTFRAILVAFACVLASATALHAADLAQPRRPRLIVQITVDQLRGDLPVRDQDRFSEGGFRRFLDGGTWYAAASHPHAFTETIVGHTTLATAAYPSRHGMVANSWFDPETGQKVKNIEDARYPVLPIRDGQPLKGSASPLTILTSTFSDELRIASDNHARVFSVSGKDRGAVPLAGHTGKAFWYTDQNGCFVTSTFYYTEYPVWVKEWCDAKPADRYRGTQWNLLLDRATYHYRDTTNVYPAKSPPETNMEFLEMLKFGRTFPHTLADDSNFYRNLTIAPDLDTLTANFAAAVIRNERLGRGTTTDYLAVSFSATDFIAHWFSPSSLESEDNVLRLDRTLRDFFAVIDKEVGLDKTLIVISADHGASEFPEFLEAQKVNTGRVTTDAIQKAAQDALEAKFQRTDLIQSFSLPYFYLNRAAMTGLDPVEVLRTLTNAVSDVPGVMVALPSALSTSRGDTDADLVAQIRRNYHENRSGDVYVVPDPQWQIDNSGDFPLLLQHDAPWSYDTYIPIAFTGAGTPAQMVYRKVSSVDVAATLAVYARTNMPSASIGEPLTEVFPPRAPAKTK